MRARTTTIVASVTFLAGLVCAFLLSPRPEAAVTNDRLAVIFEGLNAYKVEYGKYPESGTELAAKFHPSVDHPNSFRLLTAGQARSGREFADAWGTPIRWEDSAGVHTLRSAGPDRKYATKDDYIISIGPEIPPEVSLASSPAAHRFEPGESDAEALRLVRAMADAIPLRTTLLSKIAPEYVVEKRAGLTWAEALAEANSRFGQRQPERAAFLRKYLAKGSLENQLAELQWPAAGLSIGIGSGTSKGFVFGPVQQPTATMTVWVARGQLIDEPTLGLTTATVEGVVYEHLQFDVEDRLISANQQLPPTAGGLTFSLGQNTSGIAGDNFFWVRMAAAGDQSEAIDYTPGFVIKERRVNKAGQLPYREVYENGILRQRNHYNARHTAGGSEHYIEKTETFP